MAKRISIHVVKNGDDWKTKKAGSERASSVHDTKAEAVERAKELAKSHTLGQVVVHKEDGKIQTEYTYGKDPFPPEG